MTKEITLQFTKVESYNFCIMKSLGKIIHSYSINIVDIICLIEDHSPAESILNCIKHGLTTISNTDRKSTNNFLISTLFNYRELIKILTFNKMTITMQN